MDNVEVTKETLEINKEDTHKMVDSLLQRLTPDQLEFFRLDGDDSAGKIILSEVLLDLIVLVTKCVLMKVRSSTVYASDEHVLSTLGETLPETFAEALSLSQELSRGSSQSLASLISLQVAKSVNSALSARSARAESTETVTGAKDTPPGSLNAVVQHGSEMMTSATSRRSSISPVLDRSRDNGRDGSNTPDLSIDRPGSAEDSLLSTVSHAGEDGLSGEPGGVIEQPPRDISGEDFVLSDANSPPDIRMLVHDIVDSIVDNLEAEEGTEVNPSQSQE